MCFSFVFFKQKTAYEMLRCLVQAEDGIRDAQESRGLGDVYKRQVQERTQERSSVTCGTILFNQGGLRHLRTTASRQEQSTRQITGCSLSMRLTRSESNHNSISSPHFKRENFLLPGNPSAQVVRW